MLNQQLNLVELPGAMKILGQTWSIYKQRLGVFLGIMVIPILISVITNAGFVFVLPRVAAISLELLTLLTIILFLIVFVSSGWGHVALLYAIKDHQDKISIIEAYRRAWPKIISYWWLSFLMIFIIAGGMFLLVIPGIIFIIWFSLGAFILIAENLGGMNALLKSREYIKGRWLAVFWRFFFITFLLSFFVFIFTFIFSAIPFKEEITQFLMGLFVLPLMMVYGFLIYTNLRALKGEIVFSPTKWQKAIFIIIGVVGIIGFILVSLIPL